MQGQYFDKKQWDGAALPTFETARNLLPDPIFPDDAALGAYWRSWELAIAAMKSPTPGSGFVSNFLFVEFSNCIFAHDTAIMLLFARYGFRAFGAIESLDNFYARQHDTGEICREINLTTGKDYWPNANGLHLRVNQTQDGKQHFEWTPPFAEGKASKVAIDGLNDSAAMMWAEWNWYQITGDRQRLKRMLPAQEKWFDAFERYLGDSNGLYITDWASADNAPRNWRNLAYGVEVASGQAFFAQLLALAHSAIGDDGRAMSYRRKARRVAQSIRQHMWNESAGFFFDLDRQGRQIPILAAYGFAPLLIDAVGPAEVERLATHLEDPQTFNRPVRVPSLAASESGYCPQGGYYLGGVWPFLNAMILAGLEKQGRQELATAIALNCWQAHVKIYRETGTIWEFLAPEKPEPGLSYDPRNTGCNARRDFAGWGAYAPIVHLLEYAIGLRPNTPSNILVWNLQDTRACGCHRYAFGEVVADLLCEARASAAAEPIIHVTSNRPFTLVLNWGQGQSKTQSIPERS